MNMFSSTEYSKLHYILLLQHSEHNFKITSPKQPYHCCVIFVKTRFLKFGIQYYSKLVSDAPLFTFRPSSFILFVVSLLPSLTSEIPLPQGQVDFSWTFSGQELLSFVTAKNELSITISLLLLYFVESLQTI